MPEVSARAGTPGPFAAVLALWDDPVRWPAFVDGFRAVVRADPAWPAADAVLIWDSTPHGAGRTREVAVGPGVRKVENERLGGTLTLEWADDIVSVTLDYRLKEPSPLTLFFVRRALRDALGRTVQRFAVERRADADLAV